jgi:hypothetical protein
VDSKPAVFSSCASPSLSELSRTIILPSPGGLRVSQLRLPKSFLASYSLREVSIMNEEWSIIGVFPEALPYSNTGEQGRSDETIDGDPGGGRDPDGADGGVSTSSGKGLPSAEGEHSRLMPLLSSTSG